MQARLALLARRGWPVDTLPCQLAELAYTVAATHGLWRRREGLASDGVALAAAGQAAEVVRLLLVYSANARLRQQAITNGAFAAVLNAAEQIVGAIAAAAVYDRQLEPTRAARRRREKINSEIVRMLDDAAAQFVEIRQWL